MACVDHKIDTYNYELVVKANSVTYKLLKYQYLMLHFKIKS